MRTNGFRGDQSSLGWIFLALFALTVAIFGGSSRVDAMQMVALRPVAALFLIPALYYLSKDRLTDLKAPAILLGLLAVWMALQLVPLPSGVWQALPGREPLAAAGIQMGQTDLWRPISMVPTRGYNALFSLLVPIVALLLFAAMSARRSVPFLVLIALGSANALLGILQVIGEPNGPLYLYAITNFGSAVGFFANHNHSAVFSALTLLLIAYALTSQAFAISRPWQRFALAALFLLVLLAALVGGSRAGMLTTLLALGASGFLFWNAWRDRGQRSKRGQTPSVRPAIVLGIVAAALVGLVAIFTAFDRVPALARVTDAGTFEDLRWSLLPVLREMAMTYGLLGSGFGSFEEVYHIHEPAALMFPSYVNHAHNDLAQLIIEGGIPALSILLVFLIWLARTLRDILKFGSDPLAKLVFWLAIFGIIIFASLFDYPLRVPLFQLVAVWLVAILAVERRNARAHA